MDNEILPIKTHLSNVDEINTTISTFLDSMISEGANFRMCLDKTIGGQRLVIVFDYDDMG